MKNNRLSKYYTPFILLIIFFCTFPAALAQNESDSSQLKVVEIQHYSGYKTAMMRLGSSLGYGIYRDMGTAPISFKGIVVQPVVGLEFGGMRRWITTVDIFTSVGAFEDAVAPKLNFNAYDISNTLRFKARRNLACLLSIDDGCGLELVNDSECRSSAADCYASFSIGLGAANFLDVTVNPAYENSAAGVSEFIGPEVSLRADWNLMEILGTPFDKLYYKQLHTELGLMPVAAVLRPGYAYIDNYTASHSVVSTLFNEFEWHIKPFAGVYTDIGLDLLNANSSRISISYLWSYHSSGSSGHWRFDHATHFIHIDFFITLKNKRTEWSRVIEKD